MNESILTTTDTESAHITFYSDTSELLKISKDGFYIREIKVNQDEKEGEQVYTAFKSWLVLASLTRNY